MRKHVSFPEGSRIEEELSQQEAAYVTQGESALQEAISILGEADGWTTETIAVSSQNQVPRKTQLLSTSPSPSVSLVCSPMGTRF